MTSVVSICNHALTKLGQSSITSLTDGTVNSNICNDTWPIVRDRLLRRYPWNFAIHRSVPSLDTETPAWGYSYQFSLPSDCLRVIELRDLRPDEYMVEGGTIQCDSTVVRLRYIRRMSDPNDYDSLFISAVSSLLAVELCERITQSNTKKQALQMEYEDTLRDAKLADAFENPVTLLEEDSWVEARY